jgi:hypothetical protein
MSTTLTIRTDETLRAALMHRAEAEGKSISEVVREILEEALAERSIGLRAGHLKGKLRLSGASSESWRQRIRERNWQP